MQKKAKRILTAHGDNRVGACRRLCSSRSSLRETGRGTVHEHVTIRMPHVEPGSIGFEGSRDGWGGTHPLSLLSGIGDGMPFFTPYGRRTIQRLRKTLSTRRFDGAGRAFGAGRRSKVCLNPAYLSGRSPSERSRAVECMLTLWIRDAAIRNR